MISRLQVRGGSDGVASVELMVLEQELARIHGARGKRRGGDPVGAPTGSDQSKGGSHEGSVNDPDRQYRGVS